MYKITIAFIIHFISYLAFAQHNSYRLGIPSGHKDEITDWTLKWELNCYKL